VRLIDIAVDSLSSDLPPEAATVATQIASRVRLPAWPRVLRGFREASPLILRSRSELEHWTGRDLRGIERRSLAVWPARSRREILEGVASLAGRCPKGEKWAFLSDPLKREASEDDGHGDPIVLLASRSSGAANAPPDGVMAFQRQVTLFPEEDGTQLYFSFVAKFVFVARDARGCGMAAALVSVAAMCLDADVRRIARAWRRAGSPGPVRVFITGDAYSEGGEQAFESLLRTAGIAAEQARDAHRVELGVEPDWSV